MLKSPITTPEFALGLQLLAGFFGVFVGIGHLLDFRNPVPGAMITSFAASDLFYVWRQNGEKAVATQ